MTDKQIIIDGIDVSGCDFLAKEDDYSSYSGVTYAYKGQCGCSDEEMCKDHPNCFYKKALKQLKRKEQECEELKSVRDSWISKCEQETKIRELFQDRLDQLKQVLEKVREYVIKTGIDHKWDMRFQRWENEILQICDEVDNG